MARLEIGLYPFEKLRHSSFLDRSQRDFIHARRSLIAAHPLPTERHSSRFGRTALGIALSYSAYMPGLCWTGPPGWAAPGPRSSLETCRRPPSRKGPAVPPAQTAVCCLRRDMSGSALSNTFRRILCRGSCGQLPCSPLFQGLLTLRSAREDLSARLESATGRFGAYPDGTLTR